MSDARKGPYYVIMLFMLFLHSVLQGEESIDQVRLVFSPKKGQVFELSSRNEQRVRVKLGGAVIQESTNVLNTNMKLTVLDVKDNGNVSTRITWTRLWGTQVEPGLGELRYDSDDPRATFRNPAERKAIRSFELMANIDIEIVFAPDGEVVRADYRTPAQTIIDRYRKEELISKDKKISPDLLGESLKFTLMLPDRPIHPGERWSAVEDVGGSRKRIRNSVDQIDDTKVTISRRIDGGPENGTGKTFDDTYSHVDVISRIDGMILESSATQKQVAEQDSPQGRLEIEAQSAITIRRVQQPKSKDTAR